jgi:hypothetical protein
MENMHVFDELRASVRKEVGDEIIKGVQSLNITSYTQAQTINEVIEVVKGATGLKQ